MEGQGVVQTCLTIALCIAPNTLAQNYPFKEVHICIVHLIFRDRKLYNSPRRRDSDHTQSRCVSVLSALGIEGESLPSVLPNIHQEGLTAFHFCFAPVS